jgi:hypothetical protein
MGDFETLLKIASIGHYRPPYGITNPKYKLLLFLTTKILLAKRRRHSLLTGISAAI